MRIVRRLLTVAVAASGLLVAGAGMAAAVQPYPIPPPAVTVNTGVIVEGDSVIVSGVNFGPGETVEVDPVFQGAAYGQLGRSAGRALVAAVPVQTVADANGSFSTPVQLERVGQYIITATGLTTGRSGSVTVRVLPKGTTPGATVVVNINKTIIVRGDIIVVSGCNFEPGESVKVRSAERGGPSGQLGRSAPSGLKLADDGDSVADNIGCFSFNVHPDKAGKHRYEATGDKSGRSGSADVEVLDEHSQLPVTGNNGSNLGILLVGSAAAATGIVLLVLVRSRRRPTKMDS